MCGFVGGVFKRSVTDKDVRAFEQAVRTLAHRGPDAESVSVVVEARAVLAFRRLAIIDIAGGSQPMRTAEGHHLVFNGEIYNYKEVRPGLAARGAQFRTSSDTEVLLHSLALDGVRGIEALKGMFALAFLDVPNQKLLLIRDRLGVKQLYCVETGEGVFFASEPKALLALPGVWPALNRRQLASYFVFRSVPAPDTLFAGIARLEAGCSLTFNLATGERRMARYWSPDRAPAPIGAPTEPSMSLKAATNHFEEALLESVRRRLVADVPVGAFLSGGLDSALVVAAMHRLGQRNMHTFTAAFPGSPDDEAAYARRVSQRFGTTHHEWKAGADDVLAGLDRWIGLNDDLVADASSMPLMAISDVARSAGCLVLLSGEGADELFGGYGSYHKYVLLNRLARWLPSPRSRAWVLKQSAKLGLVRGQDMPRVEEYFVKRAPYLGTAALAGAESLRALLGPDEFAALSRVSGAEGATMADLCRFDLGGRIPDDLLVRTDRATMGASIEARVPFLDHDLVELALTMPDSARAVPGLSKVVPRLVALRWGVPIQTIVHRKIGFQLPLGDWFRGPLRTRWETALDQRVVPGINYNEVQRLYTAHTNHHGEFEEMLWRVMALECWYRRYISGDVRSLMPVTAWKPFPREQQIAGWLNDAA